MNGQYPSLCVLVGAEKILATFGEEDLTKARQIKRVAFMDTIKDGAPFCIVKREDAEFVSMKVNGALIAVPLDYCTGFFSGSADFTEKASRSYTDIPFEDGTQYGRQIDDAVRSGDYPRAKNALIDYSISADKEREAAHVNADIAQRIGLLKASMEEEAKRLEKEKAALEDELEAEKRRSEEEKGRIYAKVASLEKKMTNMEARNDSLEASLRRERIKTSALYDSLDAIFPDGTAGSAQAGAAQEQPVKDDSARPSPSRRPDISSLTGRPIHGGAPETPRERREEEPAQTAPRATAAQTIAAQPGPSDGRGAASAAGRDNGSAPRDADGGFFENTGAARGYDEQRLFNRTPCNDRAEKPERFGMERAEEEKPAVTYGDFPPKGKDGSKVFQISKNDLGLRYYRFAITRDGSVTDGGELIMAPMETRSEHPDAIIWCARNKETSTMVVKNGSTFAFGNFRIRPDIRIAPGGAPAYSISLDDNRGYTLDVMSENGYAGQGHIYLPTDELYAPEGLTARCAVHICPVTGSNGADGNADICYVAVDRDGNVIAAGDNSDAGAGNVIIPYGGYGHKLHCRWADDILVGGMTFEKMG